MAFWLTLIVFAIGFGPRSIAAGTVAGKTTILVIGRVRVPVEVCISTTLLLPSEPGCDDVSLVFAICLPGLYYYCLCQVLQGVSGLRHSSQAVLSCQICCIIILADITIGANQPAGSKRRAMSDNTVRLVYAEFLSIKGTLKKNVSSLAFQRMPNVLALFDSGRLSYKSTTHGAY
ncbi:hypothetical protein FF38_08291 [Lucilia cuprina]|uniref:Secreted protein n=1 Tax=Lucilia cuprina TaxID=7375 RepID=A0A0L0CNT8_LUCCU|nr:hypothetical protein FF38_08291 [Lucilia cuprina]